MKKHKQKKSLDAPLKLSIISLILPIAVLLLNAISRLDSSHCATHGFNEGSCFRQGLLYFLFKILAIGMLCAAISIAIIALAKIKNTNQRILLICISITAIIITPIAFILLIK